MLQLVAFPTQALQWRGQERDPIATVLIDVVGDGCDRDATAFEAADAQGLTTQLCTAALAPPLEFVPAARIAGGWITTRCWHGCRTGSALVPSYARMGCEEEAPAPGSSLDRDIPGAQFREPTALETTAAENALRTTQRSRVGTFYAN